MTLFRISTNQLQFLNIQEIIECHDVKEIELIIIPKTMSEDRVSRIWGDVLQRAWKDTEYNILFIVVCDDRVAEKFGLRHTHADKYLDITKAHGNISDRERERIFKTRMREFADRFRRSKE